MLKSLLQHHSSKASILQRWCSAFFMIQLSHPYMTTGKTIALTRRTFVSKIVSAFDSIDSKIVYNPKWVTKDPNRLIIHSLICFFSKYVPSAFNVIHITLSPSCNCKSSLHANTNWPFSGVFLKGCLPTVP